MLVSKHTITFYLFYLNTFTSAFFIFIRVIVVEWWSCAFKL